MVNAILAKRVNHIVTKGDNPAWPKGSKSRGFSSFRELQERHGICSATLSVWIKKYKAEVLRRFPVKDLPLYVLKYQETMTTEEENELTRLRRENEDLKLLHEANLLMIDMAKERFGIDIKKNYEEMLSGGCLKEVPGVKGNDE